ncbi:MAG: hypothetical protein IV100_15125 [Myxococcales bacterium]|nr:hypothetical protein [Myxococcales bacterium]
MNTATALARSRTAWTALATVVVAIVGPRVGLTPDEVASLVGALQLVIGALYVQDKRARKR